MKWARLRCTSCALYILIIVSAVTCGLQFYYLHLQIVDGDKPSIIIPGISTHDKAANMEICELPTLEQLSLQDLLSIISEDGPGRIRLKDIRDSQPAEYDLWHWVQKRISYAWDDWLAARHRLNVSHSERRRKRIIIVPGLLLATNFASNTSTAFGDLVQWADLIASSYMLGHEIIVMKDFYQVARGLRYGKFHRVLKPGCPMTDIDLIYADIIAMKTFPQDVLVNYKEKFRVLDAYGTQAMYNDPFFAAKYNYSSPYGGLSLNLKQFYTFYPHTVDNTFLGFAVSIPKCSSKKGTRGILYGKSASYFHGYRSLIKVLANLMELHATVANYSSFPVGVINHGVISFSQYEQLLCESKILVGVGEPLESSGVIEALAAGCVFINPKFTKQCRTVLQAMAKPTLRQMTSQVPYLETVVGEPHVYTVDLNNITSVVHTVKKILALQVSSYVPVEFTHFAFMQRLNTYMENQNFHAGHIWPSLIKLVVHMSEPGASCSDTCKNRSTVCEPAYFSKLNSKEFLYNQFCETFTVQNDSVIYPASSYSSNSCIMQQNYLLFSCDGSRDSYQRICPCRTD